MLKCWKNFRYVVLGAVVLQFGGCGGGFGGIWQDLLTSSVSYTILEFVSDNNGVFDLFTDN